VWAEQQTFLVENRVVSVRINSLDHAAAVLALLPEPRVLTDDDLVDTMLSVLHGGAPQDGRRPFHLAFLNHKRVARSDDFDSVLRDLGAALHARLTRTAST
jgi:hypothetical protein